MEKLCSKFSRCFGACVLMLSLTMFITAAQAQAPKSSKEFKFKLSTPYKVVDALNKHYFHDGNTIISIKYTKKKNFTIQKFDCKTMREVSVREVTDFPDGYVDEGFVQVPGKVLFFYSLWDRKNETEQLFVREIEFTKGNIAPKPVQVLTVKGKLSGTPSKTSAMGYGMEIVNKFDFDVAFDSTQIVVRYRKKPESKDDSKNFDVIGLNVFNYDGTALVKEWAKEVTLPYSEKFMEEMDFTVDSQGNTYILAKVFSGDKKIEKDDKGNKIFRMEILKVDAATQALSKVKVNIGAQFINSVLITETKGNVIAVMGYYNKGSKNDPGVEGMFISKLSPDGSLTDLKPYDIPHQII